MNPDYIVAVIEAAKAKLEKSGKPISEAELIRGTVHILKKWIGGEKNQHTSKSRFKKEVFTQLLNNDEWRKEIIQLPDKKFDFRVNHQKKETNMRIQPGLSHDACVEVLKIKLMALNPFSFESLIKDLMEKKYPEYKWLLTSKTGDKGIDVLGKKKDDKNPLKNEMIFVQVKKFKGTVGRIEADKFSGVLARHSEDKLLTKVEGLFITTGNYPPSFQIQLDSTSFGKISFLPSWDGDSLAEEMISLGIGVTFVLDKEFWKKYS